MVALHTGMRKGEILKLKWEDIDFRRGIVLVKDTKNNEWREIPMNGRPRETLKALPRVSPHVFSSKAGKPISDIRGAFATALRMAAIKNFRFHDLRHTFASNLVMVGIDLNTVKELLGHKTIQMTLRYSHLSPLHKRQAVEKLEKEMDTNMDTSLRLVEEPFA